MPQPSDFPFHVDSSCDTDSTDLRLPSARKESDQTVIHTDMGDTFSNPTESQIGSDVSCDEHTKALIQAAARAVVESIERDAYAQADSVLSARTEEGYEAGTEGTEHTYGQGTELTYDGTELTFDSEAQHNNHDSYDGSEVEHYHHDPYDGSASSHHEDDVFSNGKRSNRSSMNSYTSEEQIKSKNTDGLEHQAHSDQLEEPHSPVSRMPSNSSNAFSLLPHPLQVTSSPRPHTPSKIQSRPPFRTPSSVRAMQMSSPTPSIFSGSPRSIKRPTVSHLGTPNTKPRTPSRFKVKKEYPLVLLHVTVLPLIWSYADALDAVAEEELPRELHGIRASWKLLQEKLADTVLERGILLPHPQDEYDVLEERLLDALELPVRPRAKILSCGHYLGPDEADDLSSEDGSENEDETTKKPSRERWCDICGREVKYEELGIGAKQKRFRIKVYASNGLMTAGAWAAVWTEMERVDVEIEPLVPSHLTPLLNSLMDYHAQAQQTPPQQFEHEETAQVHEIHDVPYPRDDDTEVEARRKRMEEERIREIYGHGPPMAAPADNVPTPQCFSPRTQRKHKYGDSLPELLLEAIKVFLRDKKTVAIFVLSVLVVILGLRPSRPAHLPESYNLAGPPTISNHMGPVEKMDLGSRKVEVVPEIIAGMPAEIVAAVGEFVDEAVAIVESVLPSAAIEELYLPGPQGQGPAFAETKPADDTFEKAEVQEKVEVEQERPNKDEDMAVAPQMDTPENFVIV
jgi:hypothetical protein